MSPPRRLALLAALGVACSDYEFNPKQDINEGVDTGTPIVDTGGEDTDEPATDTASIRGRVCDLTGEGWVVGAKAWIDLDADGDGTAETQIEATTDADGWFQLNGVPLGEHTINVQKGSFSTTIAVTVTEPGLTELAESECIQQEDVKIAVITGDYDHIQSILADMELEFDVYNGTSGSSQYLELLRDPELMSEYDIIFFNCGISDSWLNFSGEVASNIRTYVEDGGSIYASDWAYYFYEKAFPDAVDFYGDDATYGSAFYGNQGRIMADIYDANMMAVIGSNEAELNYDLGAWVVPTSAMSTVDVLVRGDAQLYLGGVQSNVPLAVRLERGGTAIYTTFHNEQQITLDMAALLEEIVLSL